MTPIEKSTIIYTLGQFTIAPSYLASEFEHGDTLCEIVYRLMLAVQVVISCIALPILALIGLFESAIRFCLCDGENAKAAFSATAKMLTATIINIIPSSFFFCVTPRELGKALNESLFWYAREACEIWDCNCGSYEGDESLYL